MYETSVLWVGLPVGLLLELGRVGMEYPKADSCWAPSNLRPSGVVFFLGWGGRTSELQPFLLIRGQFRRNPNYNLEQGCVAAPTHLLEVIIVQWYPGSSLETNTGVKNPWSRL